MRTPTLRPPTSLVALLALVLLSSAPLCAQSSRVPGERWMQYATPEQAGFSSEGLARARALWERSRSAAYMVVHRGAVVAAWGDVERRLMCHSVRKSFLSGLIGTAVEDGALDLEATLDELGIDDSGADGEGLTRTEMQATVHDLLKARSGVYRLAAYEPPQNPKPERGAHDPGTFWCYNNWDFNTLLTIYEQETGERIFEAFEERFAAPLGMQDYRPRDGYYHYERDKSEHPAYPFRMSARDMARFGLLYLNEGRWGDARVLPAAWVEASRQEHSREGVWEGGGYGYMWWTAGDEELRALGAYSARGTGGQLIQVVPGAELVLVNRTDTFAGHRVDSDELWALARAVLAAREGQPAAESELVPCPERPARAVALEPELRPRLVRRWSAMGREFEVRELDGGLVVVLDEPEGMTFDLWPTGARTFELEGYGARLLLELDPEDPARDLLVSERDLNAEGYAHLQAGRDEEALAVFERAVELFPDSWNAWDSLGEACSKAGLNERALASYRRSLELNPRNSNAERMIERMASGER